MTPERWQQVKDVLQKALELKPEDRAAFLDQRCAEDQSLRQEVETLLSSSDEARSSFLESASLHVTLTPGTKLGDYEVLKLLGSGGMGEVYRARDLRLRRDVAIKVLPAFLSSDKERLRRFEQEARAAAALNHPNILAVFQMGTYEGAPYLVSELLEGETLRDEIKRGPLAARKAVEQAVQIARGLAAAHEKGIVHRDLKPENLFATKDGRIKILDFGLAKLKAPQQQKIEHSAPTVDAHGTEPGAVMGTVGYMAPEQVRGQEAEHRADIFAFGAVLYELLSGKRAFQKPTSAETMSAILNEEPPGVSQLAPATPPALQRVVHRCMEKAPEQRFQSASDLAFALEALSESASASRATTAQPTQRRTWKWFAVAAVAVVLAALALMRWVGWPRRPAEHPTEFPERQLTTNPPENWVQSAAISPDGKYLAYIDQTGLLVRSLVSGETRPVSLAEELARGAGSALWLPEGGKLLVTVAGTGQSPSMAVASLWIITLIGEAQPRKFLDNAGYPAISPNGQSIAFMRGEPSYPDREIWTSGINGEAPRVLIAQERGVILSSAAWSPDGLWIAYWRAKSESFSGGSVEVRPVGGGPAKTLVPDASLPKPNTLECWWDPCLVWLADGRLLFTAAEEPGPIGKRTRHSLWQVRVDPLRGETLGKPERISQWTDFYTSSLSATADHEHLSLLRTRINQDVYLGELNEDRSGLRGPRRFTLDNRDSFPDAWTRDSKALLISSNRNGKYEIFRQELTRSVPDRIAAGAQDLQAAELSPDGSWLLYAESDQSSDPSPGHLMRQPVAGGSPEKIWEFPDYSKIGYSCPRKVSIACVLSELQGKELVFYTLDPVRGKGQEISRIEIEPGEFSSWQVSPDGSQLAVVDQSHKDQIRVLTFADRAWHDIAVEPGLGYLESVTWAADGRGFFLTRGGVGPDSFNLLRVTQSGKVHLLLHNGRQWFSQPRPSPDGKYLAFQAQTWDSNVWMLDLSPR